MALTKAEMSEYLFDKFGLSKRDAKELAELFSKRSVALWKTAEQVKLSGFGNFDLRDKNQRPGRNPKTGEDNSHYSTARGDLQTRAEVKSRVENASPKDEYC